MGTGGREPRRMRRGGEGTGRVRMDLGSHEAPASAAAGSFQVGPLATSALAKQPKQASTRPTERLRRPRSPRFERTDKWEDAKSRFRATHKSGHMTTGHKGSSVRNPYVSPLCPIVIRPYMCTPDRSRVTSPSGSSTRSTASAPRTQDVCVYIYIYTHVSI